MLCFVGLGCNDLSGLAGKQALPSGTPNPSSFDSPAGALALYHGVIFNFQQQGATTDTSVGSSISGNRIGAFVGFVLSSGLLTDELHAGNLGGTQLNYSVTSFNNLLDARQLPEGQGQSVTDPLYTALQGIRNSAGLAIGALATYDSTASPALRGQMYALQGYSIILLADLYCSGVPLSTLDFHEDFTYLPGSTTEQLYLAAIAKFDTALTLSRDSVRILNLARVGKGRAFLDLGQFDSAAIAVDSVPMDYGYRFLVNWQPPAGAKGGIFASYGVTGGVTVADTEGRTGLPYLSSGDPRSASQIWGNNTYRVPQYAPVKYGGATPGFDSITVADGIEARLIQAEAALNGVATGSGSWLDQLNALRQAAITPALPALSDPVTDSARVAMLFQERAFWLFLTGHRQGDLRRMIRQYNVSPDAAYPGGAYPAFGQLSQYGGDVTAPVPTAEHANPHFTGCLSRGA
jgi:hypothetical protein